MPAEEIIVATPSKLREIFSEEFSKIYNLLLQQTSVQKEFLTTGEVEEIFGISKSTLEVDRVKKRGIPYTKKGRLVLYSIEDVREYLEKNKIQVQ